MIKGLNKWWEMNVEAWKVWLVSLVLAAFVGALMAVTIAMASSKLTSAQKAVAEDGALPKGCGQTVLEGTVESLKATNTNFSVVISTETHDVPEWVWEKLSLGGTYRLIELECEAWVFGVGWTENSAWEVEPIE